MDHKVHGPKGKISNIKRYTIYHVIQGLNIPLIDALEMPLLRSTFTALFAMLFREVLFMLFLFRGILGVTVVKGTWSVTASSATGDGVLMRDTENRPCTVGVCLVALGVSILFADAALGEGDLDFGDFFAGVSALGEGDLDFGDFFAGVCALGEGDLDFGDFFAGVSALGEGDLDFGDFFAGVSALGEGDLDFGDFFAGDGVLGEACAPGDFLGDGCSYKIIIIITKKNKVKRTI